jgi:hypothetical protein
MISLLISTKALIITLPQTGQQHALTSRTVDKGVFWRAMNYYALRVDDEAAFSGFQDEDHILSLEANMRGQLAITPARLPVVLQTQSQSNPHGLTDQYLTYGTSLRYKLTRLVNPVAVSTGTLGSNTTDRRAHVRIERAIACPFIVPRSVCKGSPIDMRGIIRNAIKAAKTSLRDNAPAT